MQEDVLRPARKEASSTDAVVGQERRRHLQEEDALFSFFLFFSF
jgi:hypothetical protein